MRLNGNSGGPTSARVSFFLPWKRAAAAAARATAPPVASSRRRADSVNTRSSQIPTTTAPERGNSNSLKLISIMRPSQEPVIRSGRRSMPAIDESARTSQHPPALPRRNTA